MATMKGTILKLLLILPFIYMNKGKEELKELFVWGPGKVRFILKHPEVLDHLLKAGKYIPNNNVPLGIAVHPFEPKMFLTIPRWKRGVVSTLNWCPIGTGNLDEPLRPYPSWEVNNIYSNSSSPYKIISVIRVFIDTCARLWVLDNGSDDKCGTDTKLGPAKILVFDLKKNLLIHQHIFDSRIQFPKSSFGKIVVEVAPKDCASAFAYITDVRYPGLVVYDYKKDISYRIQHSYLEREPLKSHFYSRGRKHESGNHIDGICLSGRYKDGYRNLYVSAHTSNKQFITTTKLLQNEKYSHSPDLFLYLGERCSNCQSGGAQIIDTKTGVMFYSELNNNAISCWNGDHEHFGPLTQEHVVVSPKLNYVSDLVITPNHELVAISDELREFFDTDDGVTTRVFVGSVDSLIRNTVCQPKYNCK